MFQLQHKLPLPRKSNNFRCRLHHQVVFHSHVNRTLPQLRTRLLVRRSWIWTLGRVTISSIHFSQRRWNLNRLTNSNQLLVSQTMLSKWMIPSKWLLQIRVNLRGLDLISVLMAQVICSMWLNMRKTRPRSVYRRWAIVKQSVLRISCLTIVKMQRSTHAYKLWKVKVWLKYRVIWCLGVQVPLSSNRLW